MRRKLQGGIGLVPSIAIAMVLGISTLVWLTSRSGEEKGRQEKAAAEAARFDGRYSLPGARMSDDMREQYKKIAHQGVVSDAVRNSVLPMNQFKVGQGLEFKLPIWFTTRDTCMPGDMTALVGDVKRSDKKRVLVSVEPLTTDDDVMTPVSQSISLDQLKRGQRVEFSVKLKHVPAQLGVFICRDDEGQGRCATKELVDYQKVFLEIDEALARKQPPAAPDRIYAFQYVMLDEGGRASTFQDSPVAPQSWDILARNAKERFATSKDPVKGLERARTMAKALDSMPMSNRAGQMVFVLPSRGEKCPTLAQLANSPGGSRLRAVLDELPPDRRPK